MVGNCARKIKVAEVKMERGQFREETRALLKMGVVFMASGLMTTGVAYLVRVITTKQISLEAAGYYTAAWGLAGYYVGYVVQAMGTDFYPAADGGGARQRRMQPEQVNEQTGSGIAAGGPGIAWDADVCGSADAPLLFEAIRRSTGGGGTVAVDVRE